MIRWHHLEIDKYLALLVSYSVTQYSSEIAI
mgnify:CR=1 FL=1